MHGRRLILAKLHLKQFAKHRVWIAGRQTANGIPFPDEAELAPPRRCWERWCRVTFGSIIIPEFSLVNAPHGGQHQTTDPDALVPVGRFQAQSHSAAITLGGASSGK